jgi:uncharacterized alpha/beta hydrolase family protein
MKKILVGLSILAIVLLTGCKGQAQPDFTYTEDYKVPDVTKIISPIYSSGYNYLIDNNTGVVYLEYEGYCRHAITVMFNSDGTVMTEEDIKKEQ